MVHYTVRLADLNRHHFEVQCRVVSPDQEQHFTLPSWIPGSYLLREFARHIVSIRAEGESGSVEVEKLSKNTWCCRQAGSQLTVTIEVFALDLSVRGAYLDGRRGFFNGTCLFLSPKGREEEPVQVQLEKPDDSRCENWQVATAMVPQRIDASGFGDYRAEDYDELIDHPVEISDFANVEFEAAGVVHRLVVAGRHRSDLQRIATDLTQLCEAQIDLFGRPPPFSGYCFLGLAVGEGYGGLEHRASCSLIFNRDDLPGIGETGVPRDYQRFLSLCSHEYFHTWNVKRIKPKAFTPYRLDTRNHTRLMWVFEGITSYYQDLMLLRSDLIGVETYLKRLAQLLTRVYRTPGRLKQSIAESSFDAWDRLYKPEVNSANATISYYSKGALVALALDLILRKETESTLDQLMRELWQRFGKGGQGLAEGEFESLSQELAGIDLTDFFETAVRGTTDLPLEELLADFGVSLRFRQAADSDEAPGRLWAVGESPLQLGARCRNHPRGLELSTVQEAGPAERAGLNPGDFLVAIDGLRVTKGNLAKRLARFEADEAVTATVFRGDELLQFQLTLSEAIEDACVLSLDERGDPAALERRSTWLGG